MRQQQQGQQSVSSQTDTVVILGPDDVLPSQNPPSYNNILKILKELQKSQQESKQMIQDLSKEMKEMKQNQQNTRMSIGSLLQTSKDLPELVVSNLLDVSVETAQGLEQCLHAKAATNSEETEKATVDQRKSAPVVLSTNTPLSSKTSSFRKTTTNRSVVRDIQVSPQTNQPEVISNPSTSLKVTSNNPTSNATSTSSPANKSNTSVSETTTTTETTSAPSNTECINQEPTATSATSVTTTSTDTTSTAYSSILESPDLANTSPTTCCTVNTASTNNTSCSSVITQPINTSTPVPSTNNTSCSSVITQPINTSSPVPSTNNTSCSSVITQPINTTPASTNNTSCSSVITQPINTTPASTNNTSCSSVITQPINTTPVPSTLQAEDTTSPSPASQTSTAILTTIDINQAAAILPASADTLIGRQSQPASTSSCAQKKSFKLNCFSGPIVEIEGPQDIQGIPENAEIRIKQKVTSEAAMNACSKANFGWILAQQMYKREELMGRNVFGNRKNILPISPRRRHALEHAVAEVYGMYNQNMKEAVNGINTGLRSLRRRLPFTPQDPNIPM
ncbi:mucin-5AC-like [Saccostrea cucullata]|uniref:mucin-5AC-like n=1 Tax=Saccostrea cuccullata TaxID=36930 RepID=UPI002ED36CD4